MSESALCVYDNVSLRYSWFDPGGGAVYGVGLRQFALLGLWVRILLVAWMPICCDGCAVLGRRLCDAPILRPEESYKTCDLDRVVTSMGHKFGRNMRHYKVAGGL